MARKPRPYVWAYAIRPNNYLRLFNHHDRDGIIALVGNGYECGCVRRGGFQGNLCPAGDHQFRFAGVIVIYGNVGKCDIFAESDPQRLQECFARRPKIRQMAFGITTVVVREFQFFFCKNALFFESGPIQETSAFHHIDSDADYHEEPLDSRAITRDADILIKSRRFVQAEIYSSEYLFNNRKSMVFSIRPL